MNQSNKKVTIKRGLRSCSVDPGETVDYEVDYIEESNNYMKI